MMYSAHVLINTIQDREHMVYNHLCTKDEIIELKPLFHSRKYDMIAKIQANSISHLYSYTEQIIKNHHGVKETEILS